jgi:hypothetical protein
MNLGVIPLKYKLLPTNKIVVFFFCFRPNTIQWITLRLKLHKL